MKQELANMIDRLSNSNISFCEEFGDMTREQLSEIVNVFELDIDVKDIKPDEEGVIYIADKIQAGVYHELFLTIWNTAFPGDSGWGYNGIRHGEESIYEMVNTAIAEALPVERSYKEDLPLNKLCNIELSATIELINRFEEVTDCGWSISEDGIANV